MKKTLLAIAAALSISANAATVAKVCGIQVVDVAGLTESVMKLGEIAGNSMLSAMLAAKIAEMPGNDFFGAMRQGGSVYLSFYADSEKLAQLADGDDVDDAIQLAAIYPMALPKDEFMKLHPGATETNGVVRVFGDIFASKENWCEEDVVYVAFSEDGKWAAASDSLEQSIVALSSEAPLAARPMSGDVIRFEVLPRGMAELRKAAAADADTDEDVKKMLEALDSCRFAVRICDAGIDIHGAIRAVDGTFLSKAGDVTLAEDPFAADDGTAIGAVADSFTDQTSSPQIIGKAFDIIRDGGVDLKSFVACSATDDVCRVAIDLNAIAKHCANPSNRLDAVALAAAFERFGEITDGIDSFKLSERPYLMFVSAVGRKPKFSASQRFSKVLPELKGKPLFCAATYSLSALVQFVVEAVMGNVDDLTRAQAAPLVAMLPKECEGGIAAAYWREDGEIKLIGRLSSDEIKNLVVGISAAAMFAMMDEDGCAGCDVSDCDDEEEEDPVDDED